MFISDTDEILAETESPVVVEDTLDINAEPLNDIEAPSYIRNVSLNGDRENPLKADGAGETDKPSILK